MGRIPANGGLCARRPGTPPGSARRKAPKPAAGCFRRRKAEVSRQNVLALRATPDPDSRFPARDSRLPDSCSPPKRKNDDLQKTGLGRQFHAAPFSVADPRLAALRGAWLRRQGFAAVRQFAAEF